MDRQTAFVLSVMAYALTLDNETGRRVAGAVVGYATRIELPSGTDENGFSVDDGLLVEDFAQSYVWYQYGKGEKPDWLP